jgi:surface polysaccharide O-acyltransferase-like enzyme
MTRPDLSPEAKQTFQVLAMLATILVVGIHYKSDIPDVVELSGSTWNELGQEFVFGGLARVAVPLFAFAAGLFYFRSDQGTLDCYCKKLKQRCRSILIPYLIVGFVATLALLVLKLLQGEPNETSLSSLCSTWILHPPAEQLWFLRDLMILVLLAPLIRLATNESNAKWMIPTISFAWLFNLQFLPIVEGWYLLHIETLLFFMLGCFAVRHYSHIEKVVAAPNKILLGVTGLWILSVFLRVLWKPNFDLWYTNNWGMIDLSLHQGGILLGCVALMMIAARLRYASILYLSGGSFFVYLIHEFPLRAIVERVVSKVVPEPLSCWFITPLVVIGCYALAVVMFKFLPKWTTILTGGRGPTASLLKRPAGTLSKRTILKQAP